MKMKGLGKSVHVKIQRQEPENETGRGQVAPYIFLRFWRLCNSDSLISLKPMCHFLETPWCWGGEDGRGNTYSSGLMFPYRRTSSRVTLLASCPTWLVHLEEGTELAQLVSLWGSACLQRRCILGLAEQALSHRFCLMLGLGVSSTEKSISKLCPPKELLISNKADTLISIWLALLCLLQLVSNHLERVHSPLFTLLIPTLH